MPISLKRRPAVFLLLLSLISVFAAPEFARADDFPSHPIHLIVPYAAGGSADATARILARQVGKRTGQAIVVENRGGSAAILGTEVVNKADPDGYTLLLGQSGPISINPAIYKDLPYDPVKDFAVVNRSLGVKTLQEFVALAKSKSGALNYGTTGVGASNHLITELFDLKAGIKMTHIPYRGTSLAVADLVAGQVQVVFSDPISALQLVKSGVLVALAVTSKDRSPVAPDVPTISESGYPGFDAVGWHGILAPAKTSPAIVAKLNSEIVQALKDPETKSLLESQAIQIIGSSPQEFASYIKQDIALWKEVAEQAKIEVK
jgi:tripartite-type tricarboxylate transporter receptor subunit TctC